MKLDILFHYDVDESTGEITFIGKEEVKVDTAKTTATKAATKPKATKADAKILGGTTPKLVLEDTKYSINQAAADSLGVEVGGTLHIHYRKNGKTMAPAIGTSEALGVKAGNKLTQSLTVSYRGSNNEKLAEYGTEFEFVATDKPGVYWLVGDKAILPDPEDLDTVEIDDNIELDSLDSLVDESIEISGLDLTL